MKTLMKPQASPCEPTPISLSYLASDFVALRRDKSRESKISPPRRGPAFGACRRTGPLQGGDISIRRASESGLKSGWVRPDLPVASPSSQTQNLPQQPQPTAAAREPFRIWDMLLLWCFALVLWSFLPEPLNTNSGAGQAGASAKVEQNPVSATDWELRE